MGGGVGCGGVVRLYFYVVSRRICLNYIHDKCLQVLAIVYKYEPDTRHNYSCRAH